MNLRVNWAIALIIVGSTAILPAQDQAPSQKPEVRYGQNTAAGAFVQVNGIKLYYEIYGSGRAMLQIHGNGGSIAGMRNQIEFFAAHYKVIAADSRGHGKSQMGEGRLTYENMADDLDGLLKM